MLVANEMVHAEGFVEAWFHEKSITNIKSYADLCEICHVCYDNWIQDAFCAETDIANYS